VNGIAEDDLGGMKTWSDRVIGPITPKGGRQRRLRGATQVA
jgi:hypothetical protein